MTINADFSTYAPVVVIQLIGDVAAIELETFNRETLSPFLISNKPDIIDIVWDVQQLEWDFNRFVGFLTLAKERRNDSNTPENLRQHFVGRNVWVQNFRTWMQRNYNVNTALFTNVDDALQYIKSSDNNS